jgi:lipopolysaccharide exporter
LKKYFSSYWIRSAFYTILQRFSITLFGFINFILIIREFHANKTQMGTWALFLIAVGIFELVKTNLLKNAQIKFVSGSQDSSEKSVIASSSLIINTGVSVLFMLVIVLFAGPFNSWVSDYKELWRLLLWFIPGVAFMIFFSHLEAVQQSHLDFKGVFAGHFVRQASFLLILAVHKIAGISFDLTDLVIYQSLCLFLGCIPLYVFSRKYLNNVFKPTMAWIKKILGYGGYIFGSGTVAGIFQNLDQLMISTFLGLGAVATYNAAFRINALVDIPSYAASEVLFPKASMASVEEGPKKIKYLYERMVAILLSFTIPMALFIIAFPSLIITIIAGQSYLDAVPILQLYMIAGILRPAQNQAANLLNSIGKARLCFYINLGYLLVNLTLNFVCLYYFEFYGAAIGTVITFILGAVFWYFVMKRQIGLDLGNIVSHGKDVYKMSYEMLMNLIGRKPSSKIV